MTAKHTTALQALLVDDRFDGDVYPQEAMSRHTTYKIGGPARFLVTVSSLGALTKLIETCNETSTDWVMIGKGSNLLVSDEGFDGVVIVLGRDFKSYRYDKETSRFIAGAGANLSTIVQEAFRNDLAGLEFAVGTPGTLGGGLRMNAGTADVWLGTRVVTVTTYNPRKGLMRQKGESIQWGYRSSSFDADDIIIECELAVESAPSSYIRKKMDTLLMKRRKVQPLDKPSCGSVFKNPKGNSAGALIDQVGLKGERVGGAQISPVHANFIVNTGEATAADICTLMKMAQTKVKEEYGIELQPEVKFLGFS